MAQNIEIIPQADSDTVASDVTRVSEGGAVWDNYNKVLEEERPLSDQLASGIMNWDTVASYFARFVNYLSQLGIFV
jgi:hypothetical protein